MDIMKYIPEGVTVKEDKDNLKIIEHPGSSFSNIYKGRIPYILFFFLGTFFLWFLVFRVIKLFPDMIEIRINLLLILLFLSGFLILPGFVNKRIIEINNEGISLYYKPIPFPCRDDIFFRDIHSVSIEKEEFEDGVLYTLYFILNNEEREDFIYLEEEDRVKFIHSVIQERLNMAAISGPHPG